MLRTLLALSLLASTAALAGIYRWVDEEGRPNYSDRAQPGAERMGVPSRATPAPQEAAAPADTGTLALLGPYRGFEIASPQANQGIVKGDDKLPVSLLLDPPLVAGHRLELVVDGSTIAIDNGGTQLVLTGLAFGSHTAQAQVRDAGNAVVARTAPITFHLRNPSQPGVLQ